jgi:hypothetical protein
LHGPTFASDSERAVEIAMQSISEHSDHALLFRALKARALVGA